MRVTTSLQMPLLIVPAGGRWLKDTIGTVTIVLILLLKPKLSVAVDRLASFFIHETSSTFSLKNLLTSIATNNAFYLY